MVFLMLHSVSRDKCEVCEAGLKMHRMCHINHEIVPTMPSRCTVEQYDRLCDDKNRHAEKQQMLADSILKKSEHVIDVARTKTDQCKVESDYRLTERLKDIQFLSDEVAAQKQNASTEEGEIKVYCKRLINAIKFIRDVKAKNDQQRAILTDIIDVQMTNDAVDREMRLEIDVIHRNHDELEKGLRRAMEQSRIIRAIIYALESELARKNESYQIDKVNLDLKSNFDTIEMGRNVAQCTDDVIVTTQHEWEEMSHALVQKTSKMVAESMQLRSFVDILLNHAIESVSKQVMRVNEAFRKRIADTRLAKETLENLQKDTLQKLKDIGANIVSLETEIAAKEKFIKLCQNRLENRAQRPGPELCNDHVQRALATELQTLQQTMAHLNRLIAESMATRRYLMHTKMIQDEDLEKKMKRLRLDEVDCMTIRESIDFTAF